MFFIDSVKAPQWKLYNKEDGDHIEEGYQIFLRDKTKGNHPVNATTSPTKRSTPKLPTRL